MKKRHKQIQALHDSHALEAQAAAQELQARAEEDRKSVMNEVFQAQREAMRETSNETALRGQWEDLSLIHI